MKSKLMFKNIKTYLIAIVMLTAFMIPACNVNNNQAENDQVSIPEVPRNYLVETIPIDKDIYIQDICVSEDILFYSAISYQEGDIVSYLYSLPGGENKAIEIEVDLSPKEYISKICPYGKDRLLLFVLEADSHNEAIFGKLRIINHKGTDISEYDVSASIHNQPVSYMETDDDENMYLCDTQNNLYLFDSQGIPLFHQKVDGQVLAMAQASNGPVYIANEINGRVSYQEIRISEKSLGPANNELPISYQSFTFTDGGEASLMISTNNSLLEWYAETNHLSKFSDWITLGIDGNNIKKIQSRADGSIYVYQQIKEEDYIRHQLLYLREETVASLQDEDSTVNYIENQTASVEEDRSDNEKMILTYGCYLLTGTAAEGAIKERIINFVQDHPEYMINIKEYGADGTSYTDAYNRMSAEIAAGEGPDIIDIEPMYFEAFAENGILMDLNPYLMKTPFFERSSYNEKILDLFEVKEILYAIPPAYSCTTAMGKTSVVGSKQGWTLEEMMSLAEQQPVGVQMYNWSTKRAFLLNGLYFNFSQFVDWEEGKCYFDGKEFLRLLELSARYLSDDEVSLTQDSSLIMDDLIKEKTLLYEGLLSGGLGFFSMTREMFGEAVTLVGYPSLQGAGALLDPQILLGINTSSEYKDVSWEFIGSFLTKEFQLTYTHLSGYHAYPLMMEALDQVLTDELKPNSYTLNELVPEDAEVLKNFLTTANYLVLGEKEQILSKIICEEAQAYWDEDKTAQETASMIQNRVQTYLNENK